MPKTVVRAFMFNNNAKQKKNHRQTNKNKQAKKQTEQNRDKKEQRKGKRMYFTDTFGNWFKDPKISS